MSLIRSLISSYTAQKTVRHASLICKFLLWRRRLPQVWLSTWLSLLVQHQTRSCRYCLWVVTHVSWPHWPSELIFIVDLRWSVLMKSMASSIFTFFLGGFAVGSPTLWGSTVIRGIMSYSKGFGLSSTDGGAVVARSIELNSPVIYVSINYR